MKRIALALVFILAFALSACSPEPYDGEDLGAVDAGADLGIAKTCEAMIHIALTGSNQLDGWTEAKPIVEEADRPRGYGRCTIDLKFLGTFERMTQLVAYENGDTLAISITDPTCVTSDGFVCWMGEP